MRRGQQIVCVLALLVSACGSPAGTAAHVSPSMTASPSTASPSASSSTPTPTTSRAASPSSWPSASAVVAANLACRLPAITPVTGGIERGWITFPGGQFVRDPSSLSARLETLPSYDQVIGAWVPVEPEKVAPDGASYVLTSYNNTPPLYLVDAKTGKRRLILPPEHEGADPRKRVEGPSVCERGNLPVDR